MRKIEGDEIGLINGKGRLALGKVCEMEKKKAGVTILEVKNETLPKRRFFLAVPFMRASKLEWILEKGTELGAFGFFLYRAEHSEKNEISAHAIERLRTITVSAIKQSGNLFLPFMEIGPDLSSLLKHKARLFFGDMGASLGFESFEEDTALFISGPEKGFAPQELALLKEKAEGVSLSPHTLRAETAPIAAASLLACLLYK